MDAGGHFEAHVRGNALKSVLLLAGFPFVLPLVSFLFVLVLTSMMGARDALAAAGSAFWVVFLVVGLTTLFWLPIGYVLSQSIIDYATEARLVSRAEERRLWPILENLCRKAGMRLPALRIIETEVLNAFASGLSDGQYSVTLTRGLINELSDAELEGVIAHELTHIRNHDCRLLVVATILVGLVPMLHDIVVKFFWALVVGFLNIYRAIFSVIPVPMVRGLVSVSYTMMFWAGKAAAYVIGAVGHFCTLVIHYALSRKREFLADAGAIEITGDPDALISALRRVTCNSTVETKIEGIREMMFDSALAGLFATHPPVEQRIAAIERYAAEMRRRPGDIPAEPAVIIAAASTREELRSPSLAAASEEADQRAIEGYRNALLRALDGRPAMIDRATREGTYRRARKAMSDRLERLDPPLSAAEMRRLKGGLELAIANIEFEILMAAEESPRKLA
jgi:heat shock protein HtpX